MRGREGEQECERVAERERRREGMMKGRVGEWESGRSKREGVRDNIDRSSRLVTCQVGSPYDRLIRSHLWCFAAMRARTRPVPVSADSSLPSPILQARI